MVTSLSPVGDFAGGLALAVRGGASRVSAGFRTAVRAGQDFLVADGVDSLVPSTNWPFLAEHDLGTPQRGPPHVGDRQESPDDTGILGGCED